MGIGCSTSSCCHRRKLQPAGPETSASEQPPHAIRHTTTTPLPPPANSLSSSVLSAGGVILPVSMMRTQRRPPLYPPVPPARTSNTQAHLAALATLTATFRWLGRIGSGTYGTVFAGTDRITGSAVAAKVMLPGSANAPHPHALRELRAALCARHPNVVPLRAVALLASGTVVAVMPRYDASLRAVLQAHAAARTLMHMDEVRHVFACVVRGLAHAHAVGFANRDVKPDNVLIGRTGDAGAVVLADWGLAKEMSIAAADARALTPDVITTWYAPPEVLARSRMYTAAVDTWSLGVLLAEMLRGSPLFTQPGGVTTASDRLAFIGAVLAVLGSPARGTPEADFLERTCGVALPTPRPSMLHTKFRVRLAALGAAGTIGAAAAAAAGAGGGEPATAVELGAALPGSLLELLGSMLTLLPERRIGMSDLLAHPYVAGAPAVAVACERVEPVISGGGGGGGGVADLSPPDTLLQLFAPEAPSAALLALAAHARPPAVTWARRLFATPEDARMLHALWMELQSTSFMAEAWLLAAYTSHALSPDCAFVELDTSQRDKALALAMLAARSTALLTQACAVSTSGLWSRMGPTEACLLASLGGAVPPAPAWLRQLCVFNKPQALNFACYLVCWSSVFAPTSSQDLVTASLVFADRGASSAADAALSLLVERVIAHAAANGQVLVP